MNEASLSARTQFEAALASAVRECRSIGYNPSCFAQMLADLGGVETARRLILAPVASDGFAKLWEFGRLDLSVEAIALRPEFSAMFSSEELDAAQRRLLDFGLRVRS